MRHVDTDRLIKAAKSTPSIDAHTLGLMQNLHEMQDKIYALQIQHSELRFAIQDELKRVPAHRTAHQHLLEMTWGKKD